MHEFPDKITVYDVNFVQRNTYTANCSVLPRLTQTQQVFNMLAERYPKISKYKNFVTLDKDNNIIVFSYYSNLNFCAPFTLFTRTEHFNIV